MDYDAVFVHMNEEYMLLGGVPWWLLGKRSVLWRNHKKGSLQTRLACAFASRVCFTSPDSYVAHLGNAVRMPIGIDTDAFSLTTAPLQQRSILFFGRLDAVKNAHVFVAALDELYRRGLQFSATLCGSPTYENDEYAASTLARAKHLVDSKVLKLFPAIPNESAPGLYRSHMIYVNVTPSGSFDKTIGEAMASGCIVLATNSAVKDVLESRFLPVLTPETLAESIAQTLDIPEAERSKIIARQRAYIMAEHSLSLLTERLFGILSA
jgi:glycosyltransferase involved in cell wall biosynthesis